MNKQKCAIIGCGFVGSSIAFNLMNSGMFSEMVLIDVCKEKAQGEAMDLNHGISFTSPMKIYSGDYSDLADCSIVIITAGANQKPDETRLDLVSKNIAIYKKIIPQIVEVNKECILLVVSNPVDILTYAAIKISGFDSSRVIGSGTVLDTARLKYLLGDHLGVDNRSVHAFIIGEHGDSELAVWSSANVSGIDLDDFCEISGKCHDSTFRKLFEEVRDSAYSVIEKKGATYYAIAMAVRRIVKAIIRDENSIMPVSCMPRGHYGIDDVCIGIPAVVGAGGIKEILDIRLDESENKQLAESVMKLKSVIADIGF